MTAPETAADRAKAVLADVQKELFALCEATANDCALIAERDTETKVGAFARGRIKEAKSIRDAMSEVFREAVGLRVEAAEQRGSHGGYATFGDSTAQRASPAIPQDSPQQQEIAAALNKRADWLRDERRAGGDAHHLGAREVECRWLAEQAGKETGPFAALRLPRQSAVSTEAETEVAGELIAAFNERDKDDSDIPGSRLMAAIVAVCAALHTAERERDAARKLANLSKALLDTANGELREAEQRAEAADARAKGLETALRDLMVVADNWYRAYCKAEHVTYLPLETNQVPVVEIARALLAPVADKGETVDAGQA